MDRHPLPSGGWFDVRRTSTLTERERRAVRRARQAYIFSPDRTVEEAAAMEGIVDHVAVAVIGAASFLADGEKLTVDGLLELPAPEYDAIITVTSPMGEAVLNGVDFEPKITDDGQVDPESPTAPSPG